MEVTKNSLYKFKHFETGLTAFISNLENKVNNIIPGIPVFVLETGDESYWFKGKFETKKDETRENTLKVPRLTLTIEEATLQTDQDTNQYIKIDYMVDQKIFNTQARRKAITFPFKCNLVCSNFIMGLSYLEVLVTLLSIDNVFTYEFLGNTYHGSYNSTNFSLEKVPMENGGTKNFVIGVSIEVQLQPMIIRYETIQDLSETSPKRPVIGIVTNDSLGDKQIDIIDPANSVDSDEDEE